MKHVLLLILCVSLATVASAGTLQFNGTGSYNYLGEPSYQYNMTLNGAPIAAMCINSNLWVAGGETWTVSVEAISTPLEQEAAWLFMQAGDGSNSDYQGAAWYLFNNATTLTPGAATLVGLAESQTFTSEEFAGVRLLVPTSDETGWTNGQPQTFLAAPTPEPGTLLTFGTGLIGLFAAGKKFYN